MTTRRPFCPKQDIISNFLGEVSIITKPRAPLFKGAYYDRKGVHVSVIKKVR